VKKLFVWILTAAVLFTACQPTPEADIVIQKNTEQMIKAAKQTPEAAEAMTLAEAYVIPETLSYTENDVDGKLVIEVDASIELPSVNMLHIARVNAADFSQETVSLMFDRLCGDYEMIQTPQKATKEQIKRDIMGPKRSWKTPSIKTTNDFLRNLNR
jgi:hypothetical protein